jgi:hypothetical protein
MIVVCPYLLSIQYFPQGTEDAVRTGQKPPFSGLEDGADGGVGALTPSLLAWNLCFNFFVIRNLDFKCFVFRYLARINRGVA